MPTLVHECLGETVEEEIRKQLERIRNGNDQVAMLVQKIHNCHSASVFLEDGARHDPDGQFRYEGFKYPPLIIEVANSQSKKDKGKELPKLADHYVTESNGSIRTVIGISLEYRGGKMAKFSIWRPKYGIDEQGQYLATDEVVVSQVRKTIPRCWRNTNDSRNFVRLMEVELLDNHCGSHLPIFYLRQTSFHVWLASQK